MADKKVDGEAGANCSPASPSRSGHVPVGAGLVVGLAAGAAPLIFALAFGPFVPRALRVALVLTTAVTLVSKVFFVLLCGESPKSASVAGLLNIPFTMVRNALTKPADCVRSSRSAFTARCSAALSVATARPLLILPLIT